jgi:hypothetical protein
VCCSSIFTCSVNFMRFYVFLSPISYHKGNKKKLALIEYLLRITLYQVLNKH